MTQISPTTRKARQARQVREVLKLWASDPHIEQAEIAEKLQISDATVCRALKKGLEKWTPACLKDIDELKKQAVARLYDLYQKALEEYEKSKEPQETTSQKTTVMPGANGETTKAKTPIEITKTVRKQYGNPRFLETARAIMAEINNILGIKVVKTEHSGTIGVSLHDLSDDELERREADLERREAMLKDRKTTPTLPE